MLPSNEESKLLPVENTDVIGSTSGQVVAEPTINQPQDATVPQQRTKKNFVAVVIALMLLLAGIGLFFFWRVNSKPIPLTLKDGKNTSNSINPYLPPGFSLEYTGKQVDFESGGTLFETRLVRGEESIGILLTPKMTFSCTQNEKRIDGKNVCIQIDGTVVTLLWEGDRVNYRIVTDKSTQVELSELEKIVESL